MNDLSQIMDLMESKGIAKRGEMIGVSQLERKALEQFFGLRFPQVYCDFLQCFGRSAGFLSPWRAIYFDDLKEIKESFCEQTNLLNQAIVLAPKALLVSQLESTFDFIVCDNQPNPKVFRIDLDKPAHVITIANSFTEYLETLVDSAGIDANLDESLINESHWIAEDVIRY